MKEQMIEATPSIQASISKISGTSPNINRAIGAYFYYWGESEADEIIEAFELKEDEINEFIELADRVDYIMINQSEAEEAQVDGVQVGGDIYFDSMGDLLN